MVVFAAISLWWIVAGLLALSAFVFVVVPIYISIRYSKYFRRIFLNPPELRAPEVESVAGGERITFRSRSGLNLVGSYFSHRGNHRRGVILFCHELTGDRWLFHPYVDYLRDDGFDIFTFDFSGHGESDSCPDYKLLQWVTNDVVAEVEGAIAYLKSRPDADQRGIGLLGVSKGGSAGIVCASRDRFVRAVVTDGAYPTHGTVVYYMKQWIHAYVDGVVRCLPDCFCRPLAEFEILSMQTRYRIRYPRVEQSIRQLGQRPLLMIHGRKDNYIKPDIIRLLIDGSVPARELWLVEDAKHNQCLEAAGDEYRQKVRDFFLAHFAEREPAAVAVGHENNR